MSLRKGNGILQLLTATVSLVALTFGAAPLRAQCVPAAQRLIAERKYDAERAELDAQIRRAPSDDAAMHCMGRLLMEEDKPGDAIDWLTKATERDATCAQHHLWLGLALRAEGLKAGMFRIAPFIDRMKTELALALALDPALPEARYALLQYYAGVPAMMGGSIVKAREQAAELMRLNPMRGHFGNAFIANQEKDYVAAEREYLAAIAVSPDSDAAFGAAGAFYRRRERWTDAILMCERQLRAMPKDAALTKVSNVHYGLGLALEKGGQRDRARAEYQASVAANPTNEDAKKALSSLKNN